MSAAGHDKVVQDFAKIPDSEFQPMQEPEPPKPKPAERAAVEAPADTSFNVRNLLRSCLAFDVGHEVTQEQVDRNLQNVMDSPITWGRPDDRTIFDFAREFHRQHGAAPALTTVWDHFEDDLEITERLKDVRAARPWFAGNFDHGLHQLVEEQRRISAVATLKEAHDIICGRDEPWRHKTLAERFEGVKTLIHEKGANFAGTKKDATIKRTTDRDILERWKISGPLVHEPTGLSVLDERTGGGPIYGSRWYVLGAPDAGKTGLVVQMADVFARREVVVGILAADEEGDDLETRNVQRLVLPTVNMEDVVDGISEPPTREKFTRQDCEARHPHVVAEMMAKMGELPRVYYDADVTIEEAAADLAEYAKTLSTPEKPSRAALFIDSVQTVACDSIVQSDREMAERQVVTANVRAIRTVATKFTMFVCATSEMNRNAYRSLKEGDDAQSDMAAGKESGAIEYGARVGLSLRSVKGHPDLIQARLFKNKHGPAWRSEEDDFYVRIDRTTQTITDAEAPDAAPTRKAVKEEERAKKAEERKTQRDEEQQEKVERKEQKMRDEIAGDDEAARGLIAANPNASQRQLAAQLRGLRSCGTDRAVGAIKRVKGGTGC